jgi:hypothetical protein
MECFDWLEGNGTVHVRKEEKLENGFGVYCSSIISKFEFLNFSPKMSIEHTIVIIKHHTTTIQTLFSLI